MFACVHSREKNCKALLVDCAYAFSPLVEETADDTVVLDIEGCELLFGSHPEIAKEIARYAARLGLKINVAVAQNPDAAIHAAVFVVALIAAATSLLPLTRDCFGLFVCGDASGHP